MKVFILPVHPTSQLYIYVSIYQFIHYTSSKFWLAWVECIKMSRIFTGFRSSRLEVFCKKSVLRNYEKTHRKAPVPGLFFNIIGDLRPAILLKKTIWHKCFPVNSAKFLRKPFHTEHLRWLLLWYYQRKLNVHQSLSQDPHPQTSKMEFLDTCRVNAYTFLNNTFLYFPSYSS